MVESSSLLIVTFRLGVKCVTVSEPFDILSWIFILLMCIQVMALTLFIFEWLSPHGFDMERSPKDRGIITMHSQDDHVYFSPFSSSSSCHHFWVLKQLHEEIFLHVHVWQEHQQHHLQSTWSSTTLPTAQSHLFIYLFWLFFVLFLSLVCCALGYGIWHVTYCLSEPYDYPSWCLILVFSVHASGAAIFIFEWLSPSGLDRGNKPIRGNSANIITIKIIIMSIFITFIFILIILDIIISIIWN